MPEEVVTIQEQYEEVLKAGNEAAMREFLNNQRSSSSQKCRTSQ